MKTKRGMMGCLAALGCLLVAGSAGAFERLDLQAQIDAVVVKGGGTVEVPAGEWEVKPIRLESNVRLHLADDARIFASTNLANYCQAGDSRCFIYAENAENVSITGCGVIDGRGAGFSETAGVASEGQPKALPLMMRFSRCRNVILEDFTYRQAGAWGCHLRNCDGVVIRRVTCFNHNNKTNDGIDIESANVLVEDCDIDADDDAVVLKSESDAAFAVTNVTIRNSRLASNCNAFKIGTGTYGDICGVRVEGCELRRPRGSWRYDWRQLVRGVTNEFSGIGGLAIECVDGGRVSDIEIRDVTINGYHTPVFVRLGARHAPGDGLETFLKDVLIENVRGGVADSPIACSITGVPERRLRNVVLRDVELSFPGGGTEADAARPVPECVKGYPEANMFCNYAKFHRFDDGVLPAWGFYLRHADGVLFENVRLSCVADDVRQPIVVDDCPDFRNETRADALERFWDETSGKTIRRLPVQVVPENVFISLGAIDFKDGREAFKRDAVFRDVFGKMSPYNCITLTLRCRPDLNDPKTKERVAALIGQAHKDGIQVFMDTDPRSARDEFLRRWPEDAQSRLAFEVVDSYRGAASFRMVPEKCGDHMTAGTKRGYDVVRSRILKAWAIAFGADGKADPKSVRDVTDEIYNAECATVLSGTVAGLKADEKLVVVGEFTHWSADVFSPHLMPYAHELMESYKTLGADGAMKDEWGFPSTRERQRKFNSFWYSRHFAEAWAKDSGGRDMLADALEMVVPFRGHEAARAAAIDRYFGLTCRRNAEIERDFYNANKRLWGPDVHVTKHSTWWSNGNWRQEFFHNGLDWWDTKRDWAQSDEALEVGFNLGMMRLCGGPCWLNEGYGDTGEHYPRTVWRYALCGGRMVYHGLYSGRFAQRNLTPEERGVLCNREILTAGGAAAESRVRLLNLISRAQPVSAAAFAFGHARAMNWTDAAFEDLGVPFLHALGGEGYYLDAFPSTAFSRLSVDADGYLTSGGMRYPAVFLHRLSSADAAAWRRLTADRALKTKIVSFDSPAIKDAEAWTSCDALRAVALLKTCGAVRQTPFGKTGLSDDSPNRLPDPDGVVRFLDGTVARIKGSSPDPTGDPVEGTLEGVSFVATGLFAVRVENGEAVALAAGGLTQAQGGGLDLSLEKPVDVALVRGNGKWRGLIQVPDAKFEVPSELKKLTDDWRILVQPMARPFDPRAALTRPLDGRTDARFSELAQDIKFPKGANVLFLGDSLTDFLRGHNHADMLAASLKRTDPDVQVWNYALGGDMVTTVMRRMRGDLTVFRPFDYAEMWSRRYELAIISLGHNDSKASSAGGYKTAIVPPDMQENTFGELIAFLRTKGIPRIILVSATSSDLARTTRIIEERKRCNVYPHNYFGLPRHLEAYNETLRKVAERTDCEYLDVYTDMRDSPAKSDLLTEDGVHVTDAGCRYLAEKLLLHLSQKGKK